jgi:hypothetical protein
VDEEAKALLSDDVEPQAERLDLYYTTVIYNIKLILGVSAMMRSLLPLHVLIVRIFLDQ